MANTAAVVRACRWQWGRESSGLRPGRRVSRHLAYGGRTGRWARSRRCSASASRSWRSGQRLKRLALRSHTVACRGVGAALRGPSSDLDAGRWASAGAGRTPVEWPQIAGRLRVDSAGSRRSHPFAMDTPSGRTVTLYTLLVAGPITK